MNKVYINGKLVQEKDALISVFDRSYLYGEGVFETIRAYNGSPAFPDMHYHRLKTNCEKLNIEMPVDEYAFEHVITKTINANKLKEAFVRVTISPVGISIGLAKPAKVTTNFVVIVKPFKPRPTEVYQNGAKIVIVESIYSDGPELAEIKSTNYLTKIIARQEVVDKKADEGVFLNRDGFVVEGTASNIFVVKKNIIYTPPLSDGCLPGITRFVTMGLAEELNVSCKETSFDVNELKFADEIFLTGSTSEILPIKEIVGVVKLDIAPGQITKRLMKAYKRLIPN